MWHFELTWLVTAGVTSHLKFHELAFFNKGLYLSNVDDVVAAVSDALEAIPHMSWMWSFKQKRRLEATSYRIPVLPRQFFHAALILFPFVFFLLLPFTTGALLWFANGGFAISQIKALDKKLVQSSVLYFFWLGQTCQRNEEQHLLSQKQLILQPEQGSPTSNVMVCIELKKIAWRLDIRWFRWFRWWLKNHGWPSWDHCSGYTSSDGWLEWMDSELKKDHCSQHPNHWECVCGEKLDIPFAHFMVIGDWPLLLVVWHPGSNCRRFFQ